MNLRTIDDLPAPPVSGLLGHLKDAKSPDAHRCYQAWAEAFGGLYRLRLAHKKMVVVSDRALVHQLLKERPECFRRHHKIEAVFEDLGVNGIFSAEGEEWQQQRALFNPVFNGANIRYFFPVISELTDRLTSKIGKLAVQQKPEDVKRLFAEYALDIISSLAFAYDMNSLSGKADSFHEDLSAVFPGINARLMAPLPLWKIYKTPKDKKLEKGMSRIKIFLNQRIEETKNKLHMKPELREKPENLLQALVAEAAKDQSSMNSSRVLANAVTIMLAGEDTTANSLAWLTHLLSIHPDIQADLRQEVLAFSDADFDRWPLPKTPLMNACIHESMRMKPVAPFLYATANNDTVLGNLAVPKGVMLLVLTSHLSNDEKAFPDADTFNPYRWLGDNPAKIGNMVPFGGGARVCPGRSLAMVEMKLAMSRLLRRVELKPADGGTPRERFDFVMMPDNLMIRFSALTNLKVAETA
ncbi:cytochrome P450 [Endozoicomonas sp.]|nr:cytochrome P450 [Endozoicomonas sp.]